MIKNAVVTKIDQAIITYKVKKIDLYKHLKLSTNGNCKGLDKTGTSNKTTNSKATKCQQLHRTKWKVLQRRDDFDSR